GQVPPDPDAEEDGRGIDGAADEEVEADTSEYLRATAQAAGKTATEGTGVEGGEDTDEADAAEEDREARQERTETRHRLAQRGRGGRAKNRRDSSGGEDEDMEVRVAPVGLYGPRPMRYNRQPDGGWAPGKPVGSGLTRAARRALEDSHAESPDQGAEPATDRAEKKAASTREVGAAAMSLTGAETDAEKPKEVVDGADKETPEDKKPSVPETGRRTAAEGPTGPSEAPDAEAPTVKDSKQGAPDASPVGGKDTTTSADSMPSPASDSEVATLVTPTSRYTFSPTIPVAEQPRVAADLAAAAAEVIPLLTADGRIPAELPPTHETASIATGTQAAVNAYVARFGLNASGRVARVH